MEKKILFDSKGNGYAFTIINLGLDTLYFKFKKGNLALTQKLEDFIRNELNPVAHAEGVLL